MQSYLYRIIFYQNFKLHLFGWYLLYSLTEAKANLSNINYFPDFVLKITFKQIQILMTFSLNNWLELFLEWFVSVWFRFCFFTLGQG